MAANLFSYTLGQLKAMAAHAVGSTPGINITTGEIVNNALLFLTEAHQWSWKLRNLALDSSPGQGYIPLPFDFGRLISLNARSGLQVVPATPDEINYYRFHTTINPANVLYYAVAWASPDAPLTGAPTKRLELWPTPATLTTGGSFLLMEYDKVVPSLVNDSDRPEIPDSLSPLLRQLIRAMAVSDEEQQMGADWAMFNAMFPKYVERDSLTQANLGRPRGGLRDRRRGTWINFTMKNP